MGGRFCSLDQLYKKFSRNDVFTSQKLNEDQKQEKGLRRKLKSFSRKSGEDQKKKIFAANCDIFGRKFVRSFSLGWLFSSGHPALNSRWKDAQISMGGR